MAEPARVPATRTPGAARALRSPTFVILLTVFVDLIGFGVIIPLLPFYAASVGGGAAVLGLVVASFFLMQFLFSPIFGKLSDRIGRRPVILGTLVMTVAGHLVLSVAASLPLLFLARLLGGTASGNLSVAQAYIADTTPPEKRAKGMGLLGAAFGVGFIVGPVSGGGLATYGLSVPALGAATIALANLVLAAVSLPESLTAERRGAAAARPGRKAGWREAFRRPAMRALLIAFFVVSFAFSAVPVMNPLLGIQRLGL
ncbi:MAG: MFS transporter, partial [Methanobacteriota archaeon]